MYKELCGGSVVKNPAANSGDMGLIPELGRTHGEGNSIPLSTFVWEILWTEEPGMLWSMGLQKNWTQLSD